MHEIDESCDVVITMLEVKIDDLVNRLYRETDELLENLADIKKARTEDNFDDLEVYAAYTRVVADNIDRHQELINDCIHGIKVLKQYKTTL